MSSVVIKWDNPEHTLVRLSLLPGWNWPDLYEINPTIIEMMSSTDQTVHLLIDTTQISTVPMGGVITHARNILGAYPPNCDMRVLLTRNMLIQRLGSIFQTTFRADLGKRLHTVASVEDAYRLVAAPPRKQGELS